MTDNPKELVYDGGAAPVSVVIREQDGWLTQGQIADAFGCTQQNVAKHLKACIDDGELGEATHNSELRVRTEGGREVARDVAVYNIDAVLSVGYRLSGPRAASFRRWATTVLADVLHDKRLTRSKT